MVVKDVQIRRLWAKVRQSVAATDCMANESCMRHIMAMFGEKTALCNMKYIYLTKFGKPWVFFLGMYLTNRCSRYFSCIEGGKTEMPNYFSFAFS